MASRKYRALIGIPNAKEKGTKQVKRTNETLHLKYIEKIMPHWDVHTSVDEYPDLFADADRLWAEAFGNEEPGSPTEAAEKLNETFGESMGLVFQTKQPKGLTRADKAKFKKAEKTGVYVMSTANPDGLFESWSYPIASSYGGLNPEKCRLVHRGYGTYNDMLPVADIAWDSTFLPNIALVYYEEKQQGGRTVKHYDVIDERTALDVRSDAEWGSFLQDKYTECIGKDGMVAIVECVLY